MTYEMVREICGSASMCVVVIATLVYLYKLSRD